jgi:hypothetical protein
MIRKTTPKKVLSRFKEAMAVVLRNVADHDWGWFSREDPRMHLQTVEDGARKGHNKVHVWLENKGKRTFEGVTGNIPSYDLKKLKTKVDAERDQIEDKWIVFMLKNGWLKAELKGRVVTITAYPDTRNSFTREIDLSQEFPGAYPDNERSWDVIPVYVNLDPEHCALAVGGTKKMDDRNHIYLGDVLFED